ncbi:MULTISPECIES: GntR family transcriptional regulator [Bacillaceae]|uniref:GntR family transcriptional regulator n=1 Tax=Bacillaceae TaxID=186817 RepID=UPI000E727B5B|nr:GntR family transcriptional regulator [Bacillus sp. PK3_68]RJS58926.1 phosphonate metabolism transcriptional regulator PhnF [Bacillus sp. PK3_68]
MINKQSPLPIYFQIETMIRQQIERGELKPGEALPSERIYAEEFGISRMTVRQAITNLVIAGLLYREKGRGTFVAENKMEQHLSGLTSFTEDMKKRGLTPGSRLLTFQIAPAPKKIAGRLQIKEGAPIYEVTRLRLADDVPMALETLFVSTDLVKDLNEEIVISSLYEYVEGKLNLKIGHALQSIEAISPGEKEREYLQVSKDVPVMLMARHTFLEDGRPLEYVQSSYRADRYKFMIEIKR